MLLKQQVQLLTLSMVCTILTTTSAFSPSHIAISLGSTSTSSRNCKIAASPLQRMPSWSSLFAQSPVDDDDDDDGWGDNTSTSSSSKTDLDEKTQELRRLQQERSERSTPTVTNNRTTAQEEPERDLFIPIFAIVSLIGLFGSYGYEMFRLYSRGELYLPF